MTATLKTFALMITTWLVIASIGLSQAPETKDKIAPGEVRGALASAHEIVARIAKPEEQSTRITARRELNTLLSKYHESFSEVPAMVGDKAKYTKLIMNSRGSGFDAFRFRVPSAGRTYQLFWSYAVLGTVEDLPLKWLDIVEVNGEDLTFTRPERQRDVTIPGISLAQPNVWNQHRLYGRKLQAGKEYVVWLDSKTEQPWPILVSVCIEPLETAEPPHTPTSQTARGTFQSSLEKLNERYDNDTKAARRKYLGELDRAFKGISKKNAAVRSEIIAEADRANLGDSETGDPRGFRIIRAEIGVDDRWNDVTVPARNFVRENRLKVASPEYDFQPDAAFGVKKTLVIVYTVDGTPGVYSAPADRAVDLPPPPAATPAKK